MRFCLSGRQTNEYLKKADELMINYSDHNFIYDATKINPNAVITLIIDSNDNINWDILSQYKVICKTGFRVASNNSAILLDAKEKGYKFFNLIPARYGYQLNALINFGVCAVRIGGQLAHEMDFLSKIDIEKRMIVNSTDSYLNFNPLVGAWIRPEDLSLLESIDVCEFQYINQKQEQALYRIYAEQKEWPGRLSELIIGIKDNDIMNRMLPPEFTKQRLNCKQSCMNGGSCKYCEHVCDAAKIDFIKKYKILQAKKIITENKI